MNPPLNIALLTGLTPATVAMFALGFYSLATRHRVLRSRMPSPTLPPAASRPVFCPRDIDEWESGAFDPDHILKSVREKERELQGASALPGARREAPLPDSSHNARTELHEAIDALTDEASMSWPSSASSPTGSSSSTVQGCLHCQSPRKRTHNRARKTCSIVGGAAGSLADYAVGAVIDGKVPENHVCLACGGVQGDTIVTFIPSPFRRCEPCTRRVASLARLCTGAFFPFAGAFP